MCAAVYTNILYTTVCTTQWLLQDMPGAAPQPPRTRQPSAPKMVHHSKRSIMWSHDDAAMHRAASYKVTCFWVGKQTVHAATQATTMRVEAVLAPGGGYRVVRYATPPAPVAAQRMLPEEARFEVHMP